MQRNPHTDRAWFLVISAALILCAHIVDIVSAGGANWSAFVVRVAWAGLLLGNAFAVFRLYRHLHIVTAAINVGTALLYLMLLGVTGGAKSVLFAYTPALALILPVLLPESAWAASVGAGLLSVGALWFVSSSGATTLELMGWLHAFAIALFLGAIIGRSFRRTAVARERAVAERLATLIENERLVGELRTALANVKTLGGLLPICAWCRRVRDDRGYWEQIEAFVRDHTDAEFSHGICPDCERKMLASPSVGTAG